MGWTCYEGTPLPAKPSHGSFLRVDGLDLVAHSGKSVSLEVGTIEITGHGRFPVRLSCAGKSTCFGRENLLALNERLDETANWVAVLVEQLRSDYGYGEDPMCEGASMEFLVPHESIDAGAIWTIWFHDDIVGWMTDLKGWEVVSSQGVL